MSTPITAAAPLTTPPIFPTPTALSAAQEVAALGGPAPGPLAVVRRHPLAVFFVLAFALSWGVEIPMEAFHVGPLQYFVGWMPGLAAIASRHSTGATRSRWKRRRGSLMTSSERLWRRSNLLPRSTRSRR